jgi:hypothetical protein
MAAGRGRKASLVLVILLVVLVGVFIAADRVAAFAAERTVASQVKKQMTAENISSPSDPKVDVTGFPFLTQVARGRYNKIKIDVPRPTTQGVTLDDFSAVATGINASTSALLNGNGDVTADNVSGTARLSWASVTKLIDSAEGIQGVTVSPLSGGQIQVKGPVKVLDLSTTVVATGTIKIVGDAVKVNITKVNLDGGDLPPILGQVLSLLKEQLSVTIAIPALPYHLKIHDVRTATDGVTVTAVGTNVPLAGKGA